MYKPYFLPYDEISTQALIRYPMALRFETGNVNEKEHKNTSLKIDSTPDDKKRWEWENVMERTESELLAERAGVINFSRLPQLLQLIEMRLRALEKK